jgi:hypothetical protein
LAEPTTTWPVELGDSGLEELPLLLLLLQAAAARQATAATPSAAVLFTGLPEGLSGGVMLRDGLWGMGFFPSIPAGKGGYQEGPA